MRAETLATLVLSITCVTVGKQGALAQDRPEDSWMHYTSGGLFNMQSPSLSPDGRTLVYASACSGHGDVYTMHRESARPARLTTGADFDSSPIYVLDGRRIVFVREQQGRRHIWIMDADGSHSERLTTGDVLDDVTAVAPDGRSVIVTRTVASPIGESTVNAYVVSLFGTVGKLLSVGEVAIYSPDSRFVIYSEREQLMRIELFATDGVQRIEGSGVPVGISRDGQLVTARPSVDQPMGIEEQLWVRGARRSDERKIAEGHAALLVGANRDVLLFMAGFDARPFLVKIDGTGLMAVKCPLGYKTGARECMNGTGALLAMSIKGGRPEYDIGHIDIATAQFRKVAVVSCTASRFHGILP